MGTRAGAAWTVAGLALLVLVAGSVVGAVLYSAKSDDLSSAQREIRRLRAELYCFVLRDAQADFESFEAADFENFPGFLERVSRLADEAPGRVRDDWEVLERSLDAFVEALGDAGLQPDDLADLGAGEIPDGVDTDDLTRAMTEAEALGGEDVQRATDAIEEHAQAECGLDLGAL